MHALATGSSRVGLTRDPRFLAGAAGGLASAFAALWAFRGLPAGLGLFWLCPLPLFLAGLGFGLISLGIAVVVAAVALLLVTPVAAPALVWLGAYGIPALLLVALGLRGGRHGGVDLAGPLALLGLWPAAITLLANLAAGPDGGLDASLREAVQQGLQRMGAEVPEGVVEQIVQLKDAALALWLSFGLVANAAGAQGLLQRHGLGVAPAPQWRAARLPAWYPVLPAVAGIAWLLADPASDALPLSLTLVLTVPLILQGLAAMHTRLADVPWRRPVLVLLYVLILVFSLPGAVILVALGLLEQFGRGKPPANI
jgi:hypothetical protein